MSGKVVSARAAIDRIKSGDTLAIHGAGGGNVERDLLLVYIATVQRGRRVFLDSRENPDGFRFEDHYNRARPHSRLVPGLPEPPPGLPAFPITRSANPSQGGTLPRPTRRFPLTRTNDLKYLIAGSAWRLDPAGETASFCLLTGADNLGATLDIGHALYADERTTSARRCN